MDRSNTDPFWNHVVRMDDGSMKCEFCDRPFHKSTSISRIKWHLSGEKGRGVAICGQVPKDVQEVALLAMRGGNQRKKTIAGSSNVNDNAISSCPQEENNEVYNLAGDAGSIRMAAVQGTEQGAGEGRATSCAEAGNHMENVAGEMRRIDRVNTIEGLIGVAHGTREAARQIMEELSQVDVEMAEHGESLSQQGEVYSPGTLQEWMESLTFCTDFQLQLGCSSPEGLVLDVPETRPRTEQMHPDCEGRTYDLLPLRTKDNVLENPTRDLMQNFERSSSHERLSINQVEPQEDSSQPPDLLCHGIERHYDQLCSSSLNNDVTMNDVENMISGPGQHVVRGSSNERLPVNQDEPRSDSSQPTDPLRLTLGRNGDQLCTSLVNNDVIMNDVEKMGVQGTEQGVGEGRTSSRAEGNLMENMAGEMMHIDRSVTAEELIVDTHESRGQALDIVGPATERSWDEIRNFLMEDDKENVTGGLPQPVVSASSSGGFLQPVVGTSSSGGLTRNISEIRGDALPTSSTKLVGKAFEENKNVILSWLMNDDVSSIGIYGMGGVGKTTLLKHIYNQLLESPGTSRHFYWVTVSRDFDINRLQNLIAKCLHLDLSNEDDELRRAVKLTKELKKKQKWVLILDDLWNSFEIDKVGIPVPVEGCKLILTTRSRQVCRRMSCMHKIKVQVLSEEEAWTLFTEKLKHDVILSPEVETIAKSVTRECAGLPLGIITMAGSMRGVDDPHEWRNTLEKLKQSKARDMEDEVFGVLKYSYDSLNDFALQQCLLYCALFPEDYVILREDLIGYLIDEGIIEGMNRRQAEFDEGHTMLNKLENVCLLESCRSNCFGEKAVKMHDLIRDMAHQILQTKPLVLSDQELPDVDKWKEDLVRVFCRRGWFQEIPSSYSPRCPSLSTLLLRHNAKLTIIADSFFKELHGLMVLDLSYTSIEKLPDSVSDLVGLTGLLLCHCGKLRHVPSLEKLTMLKRLDLSHTALKKIPRGLECLSNLRFLRLNVGGVKEFPSGTLSKLLNLQVLILEDDLMYGPVKKEGVTVKGKEVVCLKKLETLECHFEGPSDLVECIKSRVKNQSPSTYKLFVGKFDDIAWDAAIHNSGIDKSVWLGHLSINRDKDFEARFPTDIRRLMIWYCNDARSLCDVSSLIKYASELEHMEIYECNRMESLVSFDWLCSAAPPSPSNGIFSSLKKFYFRRCGSMKKLFPPVLLPNLVNLEEIVVSHCEEMEEIIARDEEGVTGEEIRLPKLKSLRLVSLPELKSICSAKLICDSLQYIALMACWKLKRMPIGLPLLDNGQPSPPPSLGRISIYPKEWWESEVEWEHKDVLLRFVEFW